MQGVLSGRADVFMDRKYVISGKVPSLDFSKRWETDYMSFSDGNHHFMPYMVETSRGQTVSDTT